MLAVTDFLESLDSIFELHVLALASRELRGDVKRLREEALNLARARDNQLVLIS